VCRRFPRRLMDVIELDDSDDDFIQSVNPSAPPRKSSSQQAAAPKVATRAAKRPPPISTRIDSDPILKPSASNTSNASLDDDECPICGRDLRLLNEHRRTLHLNSCLDDGEAKADLDKNLEKWKSTMDCPVCKTPLAAGPFRSAHIKKCGREHAINGRDLLNLVTTQEKVTESRRKRALPHTSAKTPKLRPKKVSKLDGEPKSLAEEELIMAKALSASLVEPNEAEEKEEEEKRKKEPEKKNGVSPMFTRIINENIRKRRSYAVVELAPRGCRCDVIEMIQSRFLRIFRERRKVMKRVEKTREEKRRKEGEDENEEEQDQVKETLAGGEKRTIRRVHMEATMANTLARLDSLSWAYRNLAMEGEKKGDISIECSDGQIRAFSWALITRTSALGRAVGENAQLSIDHPITVVRHWLQYVHCARVEWAIGAENDGVREIAKLHGPEVLVEECARLAKTRREFLGFGRVGGIIEEETASTIPPAATVPSVETEEEIAEEPVVPSPVEDASLPSDDAIEETNDEEEKEQPRDDGTIDSEGSMSDALKKRAANRLKVAQLSSKPRPLDGTFLAALQASPREIVNITVSPNSVAPPHQESSKDSFFDSIAFGVTPKRKDDEEQEEQAPPTTVPPSAVGQPTEQSEESAESMDENDAMRNILDVSCLRRSPKIRVGSEEKEEGRENVSSPVLFEDSDESMQQPAEMSQILSSPVRRSPRRSLSQSIPADTVTPKTSRPALGGKSILAQAKEQEVIYLDDTPVASPAMVVKPDTIDKPDTVLIEKTEEEESTVDETIPRMDLPSYGQGGLDTVDDGEAEGNRDDPMEERSEEDYFEHDYHEYDAFEVANEGYGEDGGEGDASMAVRAQEEVDSFLLSMRFNETREKTRGVPLTEETDSFLLSLRREEQPSREGEESEDGNGDILGGLSPVRREEEEENNRFKTPTVPEGRGRGRGRGARGGRGAVFGSHVKVLKWSNVTPKPQFEAMNDEALKAQLARYGLRPMGRKRAIATLSEIYEQTHPVVDEDAAGPSNSAAAAAAG
ncbi:hypothetical protein PMAYCL1PPCAC_13455, partial [Pristionchus mayeri]